MDLQYDLENELRDWPEEKLRQMMGENGSGNKGTVKRPTLGKEALYGLAGEVVGTIDQFTEADPAAVLTTLLVSFGNVVGRTPFFKVEFTEHYLNLFAGLVGATSRGRKGQSWSTLRHVFKQIDCDWIKDRVTSGLSSGEGLVNQVRDPIVEKQAVKEKGKVIDYQDVTVDQGVTDKRLLLLEQELSQALKVMARDGNILSAIVRQAWDSGDLHPLTKQSPIRATDAHISLVGHITKDELLRHLDETEKANGFANRFIWLVVERSKFIPNPQGVPDDILCPLVDRLQEAVYFARKTSEMRRDGAAEVLWAAVYPRLSEGKPGMLGAVTSRAEAQTMRIACIYALLDLSEVVRVEHLKAALAVWKYAETSARLIFGDSLGDPIADRIWKAIRQSGGMSESEIHDLFGRHNSKAVSRAIEMLYGLGLIESEPVETGGRPKTIWRACEKSEESD